MTMAVAERIVVSAIVKSRAEKADGFELELVIASFRSDYPITVDRVPKALADQLPPREEFYSLVLLRRALRRQKNQEAYSGRLPWHYYWGLDGLATAEEQAAKNQEPDPLEKREHRIMRSTALAQAVAFLGQGGHTPEGVLEVAAVFYVWLRDDPQEAPQEAQDAASAPAAPVAPSASSKAPPAKGAPAPSGGVARGPAVKATEEELFPEGPVWPEVAPGEREKVITNEDWEKVSETRKDRGILQPAFTEWCRSKWGLQYGKRVRRGDLAAMVAWLQGQAIGASKPGS